MARPATHVSEQRRLRYAELCAVDLSEGRWPRVHAHARTVGLSSEAALRLLESHRFAEAVPVIADGLRAAA